MAIRSGAVEMRTFHLPMPDDLLVDLRQAAEAERRPATEIVREALAGWLQERRHRSLADEIARYASTEAGGPLDLDPDLEEAGIEHILGDPTP
jgi:hypothetical protein